MKKCKKCGAIVTTKFCGNCGAKVEEADEQTQNLDMGGIFNIINEQVGAVLSDPDFMKSMQAFMVAIPGMNQQDNPFASATAKPKKSNANPQQNQEARLAILNNMCPSCAADFSPKEEKCKKCGASLLLEDYQ